MNSKKGSRFGAKDRTKLQEVIPLETPYLLFIDPSSACNFNCHFCACSKSNKANWAKEKKTNIMSYELYRKVIEDACTFKNKIKTLRLYKEGEPLLNKRLPDMINYAKKKDVCESIDFTTNGSLLSKDLNLALVDAGLDRINISVGALDEKGFLKNSGAIVNIEKFVANIEHLYKNKQQCHIFIKTTNLGLGGHIDQDFYNLFEDKCDEISIEYISPVWPGFDIAEEGFEFKQGIYGNDVREVEVCPYIFYSICVNSDGSVSACLMDWNHGLIVGNAKEQPITEIWRNDIMNKMRIDNLKNNRKQYDICSQCGQLVYASIDSIDEYKEIILGKSIK